MRPEVLQLIWNRRLPLALFVGGAAAVSILVALLLPSWYRAQATILPPQEDFGSATSITSLLESSALSRVGLTTNGTPSDLFQEILESRRLGEFLVERFDLQQRYHTKGTDRTIKALHQHMSVNVKTSGVLVLQIEDRDAKTAAAMANSMIDELDRFNREAYNTRAKRTRIFLEGRVADAETHMKESEQLLTQYEGQHGVVADDPSGASGLVGDALARKMNLQIRQAYISSYAQPGSPDLREVEASLEAVDRELAKLPPVKQEGARLAMDAAIQRKVFTMLTEEYEAARVQEQRDTPTLTVLDEAGVPEMHSRPRRGVIVAVSVLASAVLGIGWIYYRGVRTLPA